MTGALIEFTNEVELVVDKSSCDPLDPPGGQGCWPGFWRDDENFDEWPIPLEPDSLFASVFEDAFPDATLIEVLHTFFSPLAFFGRQTVAALLNATSPQVDFDLSPAEVIAIFNDTYPGTDLDYIEQGLYLAQFNFQECAVGDATLVGPTTGPRGRK